jgi:hypothetical protein
MKLYATIQSERESRPATKGGDKLLTMRLSDGHDVIDIEHKAKT